MSPSIAMRSNSIPPAWVVCPSMVSCQQWHDTSLDCTNPADWITCPHRDDAAIASCHTCRRPMNQRCPNGLSSDSPLSDDQICGYYQNVCRRCGKPADALYNLKLSGFRNFVPMCYDCANNLNSSNSCYICGSILRHHIVLDGRKICADCGKMACVHCGAVFSRRRIIDDGVCDACRQVCILCPICHSTYHPDDIRKTDDGQKVCYACYGSILCEYCGLHEVKHDSCIAKRFYRRDYFTDLRLIFCHLPNEISPIHYGLELECTATGYYKQALKRVSENPSGATLLNYLIPTRDGSLPDDGVEFKMVPMSIKFADAWFDKYAEFFDKFRITRECGSHVSVSKSVLNLNSWVRLALLYYNDDFQRKFKPVIGRDFSRFAEKKHEKDGGVVTNQTSRYHAINFTGNRVEFRQFKLAHISRKSFLIMIVFLDTLIRFMRKRSYAIEKTDILAVKLSNEIYKQFIRNLYDYGISESDVRENYASREWRS